MIQAVTAAVIWGLVLCLLPGLRTRKDHSILVAAVAIATALTLNVDPIYLAGDQALGSHNLLDLLANILMVVGIYFLSQAILRAAELTDAPLRRDRRGLLILGLVTVGLVLAFLGIEAPASSTKFMSDYGDQPAAALYSAIQFVYIGVVVGVTGYVLQIPTADGRFLLPCRLHPHWPRLPPGSRRSVLSLGSGPCPSSRRPVDHAAVGGYIRHQFCRGDVVPVCWTGPATSSAPDRSANATEDSIRLAPGPHIHLGESYSYPQGWTPGDAHWCHRAGRPRDAEAPSDARRNRGCSPDGSRCC
ncbi:membrane hypothetical protein [Arthrobacter sp. 9AX]|nr:membrane hypothetical protein [Arthrobacter sp. 9AX]